MHAKVDHVIRIVKCKFGYRKVRYRGIAKNGAGVLAVGVANLYLAGHLRPPDDTRPSAPARRCGWRLWTIKTFA